MAKKPRAPETFNYKSLPALAAYIDRVGAVMLNYRKYMVREQLGNGYYREIAVIKVDDEGIIYCSAKDLGPTKKELEAIQAEMVEAIGKFPKHIGATELQIKELLEVSKAKRDMLYVFWNRSTGLIDFVQERRNHKDGTKDYFPWTYYNDGRWRQMEPIDKLPLWKPKTKRSNKIMIHEGAKTAAFVEALCTGPEEDGKKHPWYEELREYEHWGQVGGALAAHRADYSEVAREKPIDVVYVCDNDEPGKRADSDVSRAYGNRMSIVKFDSKWKTGFDLADPMDVEAAPLLWSKGGRYIGPRFADLKMPATYATRMVPNADGKGKHPILTEAFKQTVYHTITDLFIYVDMPDKILTESQFNNSVSPFSDLKSTGDALKKDNASKGVSLDYDPIKAPGLYSSGERSMFINTHVPSYVRERAGDPTPFIEFIEYFLPQPADRIEVMRLLATIHDPLYGKPHYGLLLISETQGVGKTTIGERIAAQLVGMHNTSIVDETAIVDSNFNGWQAHKRLAVCNEIYAGHNSKAYDKLKSVVADKYLSVNKKYQAEYTITNQINVIACSNSMRALKLDDDDRRWLVPEITKVKLPPKWWGQFFAWLEEEQGIEIVKWFMRQVFADKPDKRVPKEYRNLERVLPGERAPQTAFKKEVINEGLSPGLKIAAGILDQVREEALAKNENVFVLDVDVQDLIRKKLYDGRQSDRLESYLTIRKMARSRGWHVYDGETGKAMHQPWGTKGVFATVLYSNKDYAKQSWFDLAREGAMPNKMEWASDKM